MPAAPAIRFRVSMTDAQLARTLEQKARLCGTTVKEETRTTYKGMVRTGLDISPPSSPGVTGVAAKRSGERTITRDLNRMGFVPVDIKGFRTITQAFGRPIAPVRVKTKENPSFADPDAFHLERLQNKHGGRVSRGGRQAFYVRRSKFNAMKSRLFQEVGRLASWLVPAARELGVTVPSWIARHAGSGRGTSLQVNETKNSISMRVTGYFPATAQAEAEATRRRIDFMKKAAVGKLIRQLPYLLRRKMSGK